MSSAEARSNQASSNAAGGTVDMHLEMQIIPVSGVDRSKQFYQRLGWRLDADVALLDGLRIVQFTRPGSAASVTFGTGLATAAPGSAEGGPRHRHRRGPRRPGRPRHRRERDLARPAVPSRGPAARPRPRAPATGSSSPFTDPDGNTWLVQEVTTRLPGRADAAGTAFASAAAWPARCGGPRWPTARTRSARAVASVFTGRATTGTGPAGTPPPGGRAGRDGPASVTGLASPEGVPGAAPGQRGHSGHVLGKRRLNRLSARDPHRLGPPVMGRETEQRLVRHPQLRHSQRITGKSARNTTPADRRADASRFGIVMRELL
jgi:hypothetical protein